MPTKPKTPPPPAAPQPIAAPEPSIAAPSPEPIPHLLEWFLRFDNTASEEERKLLLKILMYREEVRFYPLASVAAHEALEALGVHISLDYLDNNPEFLQYLNRFERAVSGHGFRGFREQVIAALLDADGDEQGVMNFEKTVRVLNLEFEDYYMTLNSGRAALRALPAEMAPAIEKAISESPALRDRIAALYR